MTREEAIQDLKAIKSFERYARGRLALDIAIEALEGVCYDEWCTDCKEYDTEKKCCPRFNRVIRGAMKREPSEDEPQDDLISRAEAIEAIELVDWYHQNSNKDMVHGANDDEHQAWYKAQDIYKALEAVPSAEAVPQSEQYKKGFEDAKRAFLVEYARESQNMRKRIAQLEVRLNAQKAISADRPRGRWHYSDGKPATIGQSFGVICDQCGTESEYCTNFCGECGADMRGEDE